MRPNILTLLLTIFTVTIATAQLYDNRSRYLRTPKDVDRFERNQNTFQKPTRRTYARSTQNYNSRRSYSNYRTKSYNNYNRRVYSYTRPSYDSRSFYNRFRDPDVLSRYANKATENEFKLNDCHCNFKVDINQAYQQWYQNQQFARAELLRKYEALFEKKIEKLLNKQFPNFKSAQKEIYRGYVKIHDNFHYNKISPFVNKEYLDQTNLLEKNTAFYNVAKHNGDNSHNINAFQREVVKSSNAFLISQELLNRLHSKELPYHGYIADKHINHYNKQDNYEYKLGMFNSYLVYYQNGDKPLIARPTDKYTKYMYFAYNYDKNEVLNYVKNIVRKEVSLNGYYPKFSLPYSKGIVNFYNMTFPQRSITKYISAGRWGRIPIKVPVPGKPLKCQGNNSIQNNPELEGIKQAILNKTPLKKAVFRFLANANGNKESQNTVLEAVGCRLKNAPFTWSSKLGRYRKFSFQTYENPDVVLSINLSSYLSNSDSAKAYYKGVGTDIFLKTMHKGIADVLKYIYNVEKYWSVEGATMRHFLKEKGLNVPSSLSNYELGKLFDFGGGNSNTLTIKFSDYARKYITNFHHGDGVYGNSLFTDPFKLQALREILNGNTVDFDARIINDLTGKAKCVYEKLEELSGGFKNMIKKFDGEFPVSHLKWSLEVPKNPKANASTSPPENYIIKIKINPNKLNRPDLSIARTMVHELIHAEMWRKIMSVLDNGGDLDGLTKSEWEDKLSNGDYPGIFDYYTQYGVSGFQHQQMAGHYRNTIVEVMKNFEPGLSNDVYNSLAWAGLMGKGIIDPKTGLTEKPTKAWKDLTKSKRLDIINKIKTFNNNGNKNCK